MMTVKQCRAVMRCYKYVAFRDVQGRELAVNCRILPIIERRKTYAEKTETAYVSYRRISFDEYISKKIPII